MPDSNHTKPDSNAEANAAQALALREILALGNQQIAQGKVTPAAAAIARIRMRRDKPAPTQRV